MSHIPQRKEKDCLNCGAIVQGKYCQNCGQENVVPHESFWHMVKHFVYDITHFDSKFFDSMKYLLFRPGFLPGEYVKGRRASYLNPIKKYVFTSAIFFLLFFSFFNKGTINVMGMDAPLSPAERIQQIAKGEKELLKNPNNKMWADLVVRLKDTSQKVTLSDLSLYWDDFNLVTIGSRRYKTLKEYDSVQKVLPKNERDGWLERQLNRKNQQWREKYKNTGDRGMNFIVNAFLHRLPYLLFVSLPLFALILKLLYIRRKSFYYADHGIFSIYHYIFTFMLLLVVFTFGKIQELVGWGIFDFLSVIAFLSGGVYLFIAMKRFYGQGTGKTIVKFILLNVTAFLMMLILFAVFFLLSFFQI